MPGHKLGKGIPGMFLSEIEKLDLTEIPGLDSLHAPSGAIKEAQKLAAGAFGAKQTFFLVNGSTVGLHAAISAVCRPGDRLIAGRDSHSSAINGMLLRGVQPVYILPEYLSEFGINTGITPQAVEHALDEAPDAAGVIITRPSYYGVCSDIQKIAEIIHEHNKILIVDEAHGAHLSFDPELPLGALGAGADICIQSAHKTLPAFTQGAYLHVGSDRVDGERLEYFLDMYQTTSPSYIIMAYLDIARELMQKNGRKLLNELLKSIRSSAGCMDNSGIRLLNRSLIPGFELDETRITVNTAGIGMTGYSAEKLLRESFNIQVEMSDLNNVVCIATVADDNESIGKLFAALSRLKRPEASGENSCTDELLSVKSLYRGLKEPVVTMEPSKILDAEVERVPLDHAAGRTSRGMISPYPPGMALVCPGETIDAAAVAYIMALIRSGGSVHGVGDDGTVAVVRRK